MASAFSLHRWYAPTHSLVGDDDDDDDDDDYDYVCIYVVLRLAAF